MRHLCLVVFPGTSIILSIKSVVFQNNPEIPSRNYNLNVDVNAVYSLVIIVNLICHERGKSLVCIGLVLPEDLM